MIGKDRALDAYLVAAIRTGDRRAISQLVRHRGRRMLAHAARLLGEGEVARDMVQEAWIEILRNIHKLENAEAFLPWALRIVSRRVSREIAKRQRQRKIAEEAKSLADEPLGDDAALMIDRARVVEALNSLSPAQSATMALFYLEEMSVAEVAEALDVPVGTVKTRLMHARANLRRHLIGDEDEQT